MFSREEMERYTRQMMMDGWGEKGQEKLKNSVVFVAGAGGLGSPVSIYSAGAGIGTLRLCDFDAPDWSNLNRQILHDPSRIGLNKAESGRLTLEKMNPAVTVIPLTTKIEASTVDDLVADSDLIIDCMDNFPTRFLLNECAIRKKIPLIHGGIWGMEGRLTFIEVPDTPCLSCLIREAPPKSVFPVVGATPGVIGCLQVIEALKYLTGIGSNLKSRLLVWDGLTMEFRSFRVERDPACPVCSTVRC